jgi:hypothetical protein
MTEKTDTIVSLDEQVTPTALSSNGESLSRKEGFFPWLEGDEEQQKFSAKVLTRFPILGAVGLIGSALSVILSWLTLHFFNHHNIITGRLPKPAAWLSIILSLNSILVHMAVSQGIATSWWYRASRKDTTVADLHNVWATGSSVVAAVTQWRVVGAFKSGTDNC